MRANTYATSRATLLPPHNSLATFIDYTSAADLDRESTVFRGTLHEYAVLSTLTHDYNFTLRRVGGQDDKGVDLRGTWHLPHADVPVVVQCKNESKKIGPRCVREVGGVIMLHEAEAGTVALVASTSSYTPLAVQAMMTASAPLCLAVFAPYEDGHALRQLIWNTAAGKVLGALDVKVVHRSNHSLLKLYYAGKALPRLKKKKERV